MTADLAAPSSTPTPPLDHPRHPPSFLPRRASPTTTFTTQESQIEDTQWETVASKCDQNRASSTYFSLISIGSPPIRRSTPIATSPYCNMYPSPTTPRIFNSTINSDLAITLSPNYISMPPSSGTVSAGAHPSSLLTSIRSLQTSLRKRGHYWDRSTTTRRMQSSAPTSSLTSSHVHRYHQLRRLPHRHPLLG